MRRAVITGGTGFVGRKLTERLLKQGVEVLWVSRTEPGGGDLPDGVKWMFGDLENAESLRDSMASGDHVFHLAAMLGAERASRRKYNSVNVMGTANILREAIKKEAAHFQFLSSFAAMGPVGSPENPMTEATPPKPSSLYGRSKLAAEEQVSRLATGKMPCTILRPPIIYGQGANAASAAARLFDLAAKAKPLIFGSGSNTFPVCHIDNLASAMLQTNSVASGNVEIYLVADDPPTSLIEFLRSLRAPQNLNGHIRKFPASLAWGLASVMEAIAHPLGRSPILSTEVVGGLTRSDSHFDIGKLKVTGWKPDVTMVDGTAAWVGDYLSIGAR